MEQLAIDLVNLLLTAAYAVVGLGPFATVLTAIFKRLPQMKDVPASVIMVICSLGVFAVVLLLGDNNRETVELILSNGANILAGIFGVTIGASGTYQIARRVGLPVIGYERGSANG